MHSREADLRQQSPSPILTLFSYKKCCIEINMTLKQAYSSEYQGVQGAFKDSMIHWILQFTLLIAFRCVLHRCESQEIRCWKLYSIIHLQEASTFYTNNIVFIYVKKNWTVRRSLQIYLIRSNPPLKVHRCEVDERRLSTCKSRDMPASSPLC